MIRPRLRVVVALAAFGIVGSALTGCAATVSMSSAPNANDPSCAAVTARLPATLNGQQRVWTDAQATGAWRAEDRTTAIVLTCGVPVPGPSTLPCQSAGGVDWLIDDTDAPYYRLTSYGRSPAIEVYLDYDVVSGFTVLDSLSAALQHLPATGATCTERPSS